MREYTPPIKRPSTTRIMIESIGRYTNHATKITPPPTTRVRIRATSPTHASMNHAIGGITLARIGSIWKKSVNQINTKRSPRARTIQVMILFSFSAAWNISVALLVPASIRLISDPDFAIYDSIEFDPDCFPRRLSVILLDATV
jgi:hypothetical protein